MCIVLFQYRPSSSSRYILVVANNRDEYYDRKTLVASFWSDHQKILAGRDLGRGFNGGTWLGITKDGQFSTVTNFRRPYYQPRRVDTKSRGEIVSDYLAGSVSPSQYCVELKTRYHEYAGFNLLAARLAKNDSEMVYCSNRGEGGVQVLQPGIYGLSNGQLDSPWATVEEGKRKLGEIMEDEPDSDTLTDKLMTLLSDRTCYHPDPNVPDTKHPTHWLKGLSCINVSMPEERCGSRTSTVILVDRQGHVTYTEKTMVEPIDPYSPQWTTNTFTFDIPLN